MKKKIIIILLVLFIAFCSLIGYLVFKDLKEEEKLSEDITNINNMINDNDLNEKKIKNMLKTYVTTGENSTVEKAVKAYYLDSFDLVVSFNKIVDAEKLGNLISIQNIIADSPDFELSKKYIENTKNDLNKIEKDIELQLSKKKKESYFKNNNVDEYYSDLYNNLISQFNYFGNSNEYKEEINKLTTLIDEIDEVLDFLFDKQGKWTIINGSIIFETKELSNEFGILLSNISRYDKTKEV